MTNIPGSEQWRKYPLNMAGFDPVRMDGELEHGRIDLRSKDLFDEISESSLEVLESGGQGGGLSVKTFENEGLLDDHLKEKEISRNRYYAVYQEHSWGKMSIHREMFMKLLSQFQVFSYFLDVVYSFCEKVRPKNEGYNAFSDSISSDKSSGSGYGEEKSTPSIPSKLIIETLSPESCYILRYVEQHQRPGRGNPWSVRQTGVYHKFEIPTQNNTWIFLQPCTRFIERLEQLNGMDCNFSVHLLLLSSSVGSWREYIDWLEEKFTELSGVAISSRLGNHQGPAREDFPLDFSDIQRAEDLRIKLLHLSFTLDLGTEAIADMKRGAEKLQAIPEAASLKDELSQYTASLSRFSSTMLSHKRRAELLLRYLEGTSLLLQNILDERRSEAVFRIAEITGKQSTTMLDLSMKSTWDARSMRTITVVALVYLPPTFVA
ncbi:hypothetical protein Q9L58_010100, partial [Maublancomyces gigas]